MCFDDPDSRYNGMKTNGGSIVFPSQLNNESEAGMKIQALGPHYQSPLGIPLLLITLHYPYSVMQRGISLCEFGLNSWEIAMMQNKGH